MNSEPLKSEPLKNVESKVDRLLQLLDRLQVENQALRQRESSLLRERSKLLEKNEMARAKVEGMITRLKNLNPEG